MVSASATKVEVVEATGRESDISSNIQYVLLCRITFRLQAFSQLMIL